VTPQPQELISRYFDNLLSDDEHDQLQSWLKSSPDHRREFAQAAFLHDQLRAAQLALDWQPASVATQPAEPRTPAQRRSHPLALSLGVLASLAAFFVLWLAIGRTPVSAATELRRLIAAQAVGHDRTYHIAVEEAVLPRRPRDPAAEAGRPPKPSLDGATLYVRPGHQFVLVRQMPGDRQFVTGSNGHTSWAVRPDGPVRFSADLTRFHRDLPGHENDVPLLQIDQGLSQLQKAYDIQLLPVENDDDNPALGESTRLLVAVKKRGFRGPHRVEITYAVATGRILQLRFFEMPYGPEHLTIRLTLTAETDLAPDFFDHPSHHSPDRAVIEE
jgi:hypothetical protein